MHAPLDVRIFSNIRQYFSGLRFVESDHLFDDLVEYFSLPYGVQEPIQSGIGTFSTGIDRVRIHGAYPISLGRPA
jgi:hypothetical protein